MDGKTELVNLACLLVSGARLILFINVPGDLEHQSRLLMAANESPRPSPAHHNCRCPNQTLPLSSRLYQLDGFSEENPRESDTESQGQSPPTWWGPQQPQTVPSPLKRLSFCHSALPWGPLPCIPSGPHALSIVPSWCSLRSLTLPHNGNRNFPTAAQTVTASPVPTD